MCGFPENHILLNKTNGSLGGFDFIPNFMVSLLCGEQVCVRESLTARTSATREPFPRAHDELRAPGTLSSCTTSTLVPNKSKVSLEGPWHPSRGDLSSDSKCICAESSDAS